MGPPVAISNFEGDAGPVGPELSHEVGANVMTEYPLGLAGEQSRNTAWGVAHVVKGVNVWPAVDVELDHVDATRGRRHGTAAAYAAEESGSE